MKNQVTMKVDGRCHQRARCAPVRPAGMLLLVAAMIGLLLGLSGCRSPDLEAFTLPKDDQPESIILREGDTLRIVFPGAPNLNTDQQIRRDGKITLPTRGEFKAAGLTTPQLEKELIKLYGPELQVKEVSVTLASSAFPVYVTGAVLRPGRIMSDRPLTALEAIMEAGGFDYSKANLKAVRVIRREDEGAENYTNYRLDFKRVLEGVQSEPFRLKPSDVVYVPERFVWF